MTWIKCSDALPDREGYILVKINGELFIGKAIGLGLFLPDYAKQTIIFWLPLKIAEIDKTGQWQLPKHFREPDEWMYVPMNDEIQIAPSTMKMEITIDAEYFRPIFKKVIDKYFDGGNISGNTDDLVEELLKALNTKEKI